MSLPARFLALFTAPAVVPLMAVGIFDWVHSMRAPERLVAEYVEPILNGSVSGLQERTDRFLARSSSNVRNVSPLFPIRA